MPNVESIVEKQVRAWSESLRSAEREGRAATHWPVITVSREFGARGAALVGVISQKVGFSVWNRALVQGIADDSEASQEIVDSLDERRQRALEDAVMGALMGSKVTNVQYLRSLMRLVKAISAHGSAIIVGRGANYVLREDEVLRVRVVAPLENRVSGYARRQGISEKEARQAVSTSDAERAEFVQYQFRRDVGASADYDIVLNSSTYDLADMAELVLGAYGLKFNRRPDEPSS